MGEEQFVSCEDSRDEILGLFNFWCTVSGVILLIIPFLVIRRVGSSGQCSASLACWAFAFLILFLQNIYQHAIGPPPLDSDTVSSYHAITLSLVLLRNRSGRALPLKAFAVAFLCVAVHCVVVMRWPAWQPVANGIVVLLTNPAIVYEFYRQSRVSLQARTLFKRSFLGLLCAQVFVGSERWLCEVAPFPQLQHAVIGHGVIVGFLGGLGALILELSLPRTGLAKPCLAYCN